MGDCVCGGRWVGTGTIRTFCGLELSTSTATVVPGCNSLYSKKGRKACRIVTSYGGRPGICTINSNRHMVFIPIDPVPTAKPVVFHCRIFAVPAITGPLNLGPLLALRTLNTRNN